jgi:hypothetical protein
MTAKKKSNWIAISFSSAFGRMVGLVLMGAVGAALCAAPSRAQNTRVTIEGTITGVGSVSGIAVGDKYSMVV